MKMNRFTLTDSDAAHLEFVRQVEGKNYQITIQVVEDLPQIFINQDDNVVLNDTVKGIDDLRIFLDEQLYVYLET